MEVNVVEKAEKSFDSLFKSLNGEVILIDNTIKIRYNGLGETLISPGGKTTLYPLFEFISTNKSFSTNYLTQKTFERVSKVLRYLSLPNISVGDISYDLPSYYLTEQDEKHLHTSFYNLKEVTFQKYTNPDVDTGKVSISPLNVSLSDNGSNMSHGREIKVHCKIFIIDGWMDVGGSRIEFPSDKESDVKTFRVITNIYNSRELDNIVKDMVWLKSPNESILVHIEPVF